MKILVEFSLHSHIGRRSPVMSPYRVDWKGEDKPSYNCATVTLLDDDMIFPGETREACLEPYMPDLWENVKVGSVLMACEGKYEVGKAVVKEIND